MSTDATVTKDLMQTLEDGRKGFADAAGKLVDTDRADLAPRFAEFSAQRATMYSELEVLAAAYGDDLDEDGSAAAAVHRGWMSLKDALAGSSASGVLTAALLIVAFDGSVTKLIQLYILGVFVSFTLSQTGMVIYWRRQAREHGWTPNHIGSAAVNSVGAVATAVVLVIVLITKFTHGAYLVVIAMPILVWLMLRIHRHYQRVSRQLKAQAGGITQPSRIHAVVLISQLNDPSLKALAFARAIRPSTITALRVDTNTARTENLIKEWADRDIAVPLTIVTSAYRDLTEPVLEYLAKIHIGPRDVVQVFVPEYVVGHWWETILHNQSALRLKSRLLYMPGVMVTSVPYQLKSAEPFVLERPGTEAEIALPPAPPVRGPGSGATAGPPVIGPPTHGTPDETRILASSDK